VIESNKTEQQILDAAYRVFQRKGKAGARMQEIADEAGINKSMLHYYFRSKDILFSKIFLKAITEFFGSIMPILNHPDTIWQVKVKELLAHYVKFMRKNPDMPFFLMNEINQNGEAIFNQLHVGDIFIKSVFFQQINEAAKAGEIKNVNPLQVFISIVSNIIFPFIAAPMVKKLVAMSDTNWDTFINEREIFTVDLIINYLETK
jgi:TetR/AcrR family transcriptional regulator